MHPPASSFACLACTILRVFSFNSCQIWLNLLCWFRTHNPLKFFDKPLITELGIQIGAEVPHPPPPLYIRPRSCRILTVMKGIQCMKNVCMTIGYNTYPLPMTHKMSLNQCKKPQPAIIVLALNVHEC